MNGQRILILGVTGGGKGRLAFEMAQKIGAEIISIDSMKVYRRMDIGTAKPAQQLQKQINYHLIDVVEPSEAFSVDLFLNYTQKAIAKIESADKPVIAVGGSSMYIKALLYGIFDGPGTDEKIRRQLREQIQQTSLTDLYNQLQDIDPRAAEKIHANDEKRIIRAMEVYQLTGKPISSFQQQFDRPARQGNWKIIGLRREKTDASARINARVKRMVEQRLVDEVKHLLSEKKPLSPQAASAIGYAEIISHLAGSLDLEKTVEKIKINTRRLAKGQRTWFKTFRDVNWLDLQKDESSEDILTRAMDLIKNS